MVGKSSAEAGGSSSALSTPLAVEQELENVLSVSAPCSSKACRIELNAAFVTFCRPDSSVRSTRFVIELREIHNKQCPAEYAVHAL